MGGGRGGNKRGRTQRKHFKENKENVWKKNKSEGNPSSADGAADTNNTSSWENFVTQNVEFEEYYKEQGIVSKEEWETFLNVLHKSLPAAFRINSSGQFFQDIRSQLENDFMKTLEMEVSDSGEVDAIRPLPWYPGNLAWHSNYSRMQLRKNQTLAKFHEFLKQANEIGNITRQEAVSMVPPLFLDVRADHFILDMCAAPGSKTFQLLEMIHEATQSGALPAGMVLANDVDVQRCNLLIHQTKRMCSANLIVTNHEAQHFPGCHVNKVPLDKIETGSGEESGITQLQFDRVLCDVPCSGDGTLRKAPDIWRKWNIGMGNGVHRLQVDIAMRGISLLKVGGKIVYSTCSMNPVENEAVVAEVLRRCGGSVELLDVSSELPQLIRRPGLKKWKVRDRAQWLASYKDVPLYRRHAILPSMFPSGRTFISETTETDSPKEELVQSGDAIVMESENGSDKKPENGSDVTPNSVLDIEVSCLPLERCMRIVPHDQNTGAFFIAVLQKLSTLPVLEKKSNLNGHTSPPDQKVTKMSEEVVEEDTSELETNLEETVIDEVIKEDNKTDNSELPENGNDKQRRDNKKSQMHGKWRGVDPVVIFNDEVTINSIKDFYGINESFPFKDHLVVRNSDVQHVKRVYYISNSVLNVLKLNDQVGQRLKITSVGLKIFERQTSKEGTSSPCLYRISSEGLPLLLPYITKQILSAPLADFRHLLQYRSIKFADFVDGKFGEDAAKLEMGCCVIVLSKGSESGVDLVEVDDSTVAIGCWKGRTNVTVMVSVTDCGELLERLSVRLGSKKDSSKQEIYPSVLEIGAEEVMEKVEECETI